MDYVQLYNKVHNEFLNNFLLVYNGSSSDKRDEYDYYIGEITKKLLDTSFKTLPGFSQTDTFILRKYYGVFDNGDTQSFSNIAYNVNIPVSFLSKRLFLDNVKLSRMIINYKKFEKKNINTLMLSDKYNELKDLGIGELFSGDFVDFFNELGVYTIEDLCSLGISSLSRSSIVRIENMEKIINTVHKHGFRFIDDLSNDEKKELLSKCNKEDLGKVSSTFLLSNDKMNGKRKKCKNYYYGLSTVDSIVKVVNDDNSFVDLDVLNELISLGFNISIDKVVMNYIVGIKDIDERINIINKLNLPIESLMTLSVKCICNYNIKDKNGNYIKTIGELIKLSRNDLNNLHNFGEVKVNLISDNIHKLGLYFSDEVDLLSLYSNSIYEQLDEFKKKRL